MFKMKLMYFIIAFFSGIVLSYINNPEPKIIYTYPDVSDNKTIYNDKQNRQFKLIPEEVNCP